MVNTNKCKTCGRLLKKEAYENGTTECDVCLGIVVPIKKSKDHEILDGIFIKVISEDEVKFLDRIASDYKHIDFETPDPNSLLSILISSRLESKRITDELSAKKVSIEDRTKLNSALKVVGTQIKTIQNELGITREKMQNRERSSQQIFKEWMKEATLHFITDKGAREGVGICEKCGDRIIFQGDFETLETETNNHLDEFIELIINKEDLEITKKEEKTRYTKLNNELSKQYKNKLSEDTLKLIGLIKYLFEIRKLPEAYIEFHRRQIEEALI